MLSANLSTAIGPHSVTITAMGGRKTHTTSVSLRIVPPSDFTLAASPASLAVEQGSSGLVNLTTTASGGYNNAVSLPASGLPADVAATFSPASIAALGSGTSRLTRSARSSAPALTYAVTITATAGGKTHKTSVSLRIVPLPDFALSTSPASVSPRAARAWPLSRPLPRVASSSFTEELVRSKYMRPQDAPGRADAQHLVEGATDWLRDK
jgi:hypothetical protein